MNNRQYIEFYVNKTKEADVVYFDLKISYIFRTDLKRPKKEIILEWMPENYQRKEGINWKHKGVKLGKLITDQIQLNNGIIFYNIQKSNDYRYNQEQPDFLLKLLFEKYFKTDVSKY